MGNGTGGLLLCGGRPLLLIYIKAAYPAMTQAIEALPVMRDKLSSIISRSDSMHAGRKSKPRVP
jgi:hypothetical protein